MSTNINYFKSNNVISALSLPFNINEVINQWYQLRNWMIREVPAGFSRDEWAYLITFLEKDNLELPFAHSFGDKTECVSNKIDYLLRPRGLTAVWLPNNVSLLGPLMIILLSLSGNPLKIKGGTQTENISGIFLDFAIKKLPDSALKSYLIDSVSVEVFDRLDKRNAEMANSASVRIVFGSDTAAGSIEALPHPIESVPIYFIDKQSEAWIEKETITGNLIEGLVKICAIYGQAGCTSPKKIVILNGSKNDAIELRDNMAEIWARIIKKPVAQNIASGNFMVYQWAKALGWDTKLVHNNSAVLAVGDNSLKGFQSPMSFPIVYAAIDDCLNNLPANIQTIGHSFSKPPDEELILKLALTQIKRFVPISNMHYFSHVWDGYAFWHKLFEFVKITNI